MAIDESDWPVVRITYPRVLGPTSIPHYIEQLESLGRRGIPYWAMVDMRPIDIAKIKPSNRTEFAGRGAGVDRGAPKKLRGAR